VREEIVTKNRILKIVLLTIIYSSGYVLCADDMELSIVEHYDFSYYDKKIFTNHTTKKIELVYPTSLIESIEKSIITIIREDLAGLTYAALTRVVYLQKAFERRLVNDDSSLMAACTSRSKNELGSEAALEGLLKADRECGEQLQEVRERIKRLEAFANSGGSYARITTNALMLVVQYAARKIKYYPTIESFALVGIVVSSGDESQETTVSGDFAGLIKKYQQHEKS
jgi:hypothetical protein